MALTTAFFVLFSSFLAHAKISFIEIPKPIPLKMQAPYLLKGKIEFSVKPVGNTFHVLLNYPPTGTGPYFKNQTMKISYRNSSLSSDDIKRELRTTYSNMPFSEKVQSNGAESWQKRGTIWRDIFIVGETEVHQLAIAGPQIDIVRVYLVSRKGKGTIQIDYVRPVQIDWKNVSIDWNRFP